MEKTIVIRCSIEDARNIAMGLDLLHSKCIDTAASIQTNEPRFSDLKQYFRDKEAQIKKQLSKLNSILTPQTHV